MTPEKIDPKSAAARISKATQMDGGDPELVSMLEAAARLRVGRTTMKRLIREKRIESVRIGRMRRVVVASIRKYIKDLERE
jgi:excisionase family DNA binding protein